MINLEIKNLKLELENINLKNEIKQLKMENKNLKRQKNFYEFYKIKCKFYNNLFYILAILIFEIIFMSLLYEKLDYNYNGFWNTYFLLFMIIPFILGIIPKIITIIVNILLKRNKL